MPSLYGSSPMAGAGLAPGDYSRIQAGAQQAAFAPYRMQQMQRAAGLEERRFGLEEERAGAIEEYRGRQLTLMERQQEALERNRQATIQLQEAQQEALQAHRAVTEGLQRGGLGLREREIEQRGALLGDKRTSDAFNEAHRTALNEVKLRTGAVEDPMMLWVKMQIAERTGEKIGTKDIKPSEVMEIYNSTFLRAIESRFPDLLDLALEYRGLPPRKKEPAATPTGEGLEGFQARLGAQIPTAGAPSPAPISATPPTTLDDVMADPGRFSYLGEKDGNLGYYDNILRKGYYFPTRK